MKDKEKLTLKQAAEYLGYHPEGVRRLVRLGDVKTLPREEGKRYFFDKSELDAFLKRWPDKRAKCRFKSYREQIRQYRLDQIPQEQRHVDPEEQEPPKELIIREPEETDIPEPYQWEHESDKRYILREWLEKHGGTEGMVRLLIMLEAGRPAYLISKDIMRCSSTDGIYHLLKVAFDRHKVNGKFIYVLKPWAREYIEVWHKTREVEYRRVMKAERALADLVSDPRKLQAVQERLDEAVSIPKNPGLSVALNQLRAQVGEVEFRGFLAALASDMPSAEVAQEYQNWGVRIHTVSMWRRALTSPSMKLRPELEAVIKGKPLPGTKAVQRWKGKRGARFLSASPGIPEHADL